MTPTKHLEGGVVTYGACLHPAMKITKQDDADNYLSAYIDYNERNGNVNRIEATRIAKINIGYFAGYSDAETAARVNRLFKTTHPIFGDTRPPPEEAFEAGKRLAEEGS